MRIVYIVVLIVLFGCVSSNKICNTDYLNEIEKGRIKYLRVSYVNHLATNSEFWQNRKAIDSIYVENREVSEIYQNLQYKYIIAINSYPRVSVIDSIIYLPKFNKSRSICILERVNNTFPEKIADFAFWDLDEEDVLYNSKRSTPKSISDFCSSFRYRDQVSSKTLKASSFKEWITLMTKHPFNEIGSNPEIYLYTLLQKNNSKIISSESYIFIN
ncbi:MAG: hypothetical protein ACJAWV_000594 [Flammeovirgaceae bacterium]|jgi:hypothetical protein